jgi:hypothetical protein
VVSIDTAPQLDPRLPREDTCAGVNWLGQRGVRRRKPVVRNQPGRAAPPSHDHGLQPRAPLGRVRERGDRAHRRGGRRNGLPHHQHAALRLATFVTESLHLRAKFPNTGRKLLGLIAALLLVGCATSAHHASLRISGEGGIGPVLLRADLRSARADINPSTSQPTVLVELTPNGKRKFLDLTTHVARAGRPRLRPFHVLISVNGKVISQPYIDYHRFPNGVPGDSGIEIDVRSIGAARELAAKLNR